MNLLLSHSWNRLGYLYETDISQKHKRMQKDEGSFELLLSQCSGGIKSEYVPPLKTSGNFRRGSLLPSPTPRSWCCPTEKHVSSSSSSPSLSLSPRSCELQMEWQLPKHRVLWLFLPPVVLERCMLMQPDTSPPRSSLAGLANLPFQGDRPLQLLPEVLFHHGDRHGQHHQHLAALRCRNR